MIATRVEHARGSVAHPLTDAELDHKFLAQARGVLSAGVAARVLLCCRDLAGCEDVAAALRMALG